MSEYHPALEHPLSATIPRPDEKGGVDKGGAYLDFLNHLSSTSSLSVSSACFIVNPLSFPTPSSLSAPFSGLCKFSASFPRTAYTSACGWLLVSNIASSSLLKNDICSGECVVASWMCGSEVRLTRAKMGVVVCWSRIHLNCRS